LKIVAILVSVMLIGGCATAQFTPNAEAENANGISVLYDYPTDPYRKIGLVDLDYYRPGFRAPTATDALPKLKAKIREVGGNAFIVRGQRSGQVASRSIIVSVEVLSVDLKR
jgi:uncharacterized lipoprotein YajG